MSDGNTPHTRVTYPIAAALHLLLDGDWHPRRHVLATIATASTTPRLGPTILPLTHITTHIQRPTLDPNNPPTLDWGDEPAPRGTLATQQAFAASRMLHALEDRGWVTSRDGYVQLTNTCLDTLYGPHTPPLTAPTNPTPRPTRQTPKTRNPSGARIGDNLPKPWTLAIVHALHEHSPRSRDELTTIAEAHIPDQRAHEVAMTRAAAELRRGKRSRLPNDTDAIVYGKRYLARQAVLATVRNGLTTRTGDQFHATQRLHAAVTDPDNPLHHNPKHA